MSSDIAIQVNNLSKCYQVYEKPHHRLLQMFARGKRQYFQEFWALKDASFKVKKGETVGIIGRNGSGKSTLLQLICGTLNPSSGTIKINGRIAALLELGSGFNPEFTGRENIFLNASILGLSKNEIVQKYDDIVLFADIGDFINQPVRTYSSGMVVRLAFAVAINIEPDILIVDEALSVGDERFQRKCFSRIEEIRSQGATVLFVSHSIQQIVEICDRAILLDRGEIILNDLPKKATGYYQKLLYAPLDSYIAIRSQIILDDSVINDQKLSHQIYPNNSSTSDLIREAEEGFDKNLTPVSTINYESKNVLISNPKIVNMNGIQVNGLIRGRNYQFIYDVEFKAPSSRVRFGMLIKTIQGVEIGGAESIKTLANSISFIEAGSRYRISFTFEANLNSGVYFLNAGVLGVDGDAIDGYLHRLVDVTMFRILPDSNSYSTAIVDFKCEPMLQCLG